MLQKLLTPVNFGVVAASVIAVIAAVRGEYFMSGVFLGGVGVLVFFWMLTEA